MVQNGLKNIDEFSTLEGKKLLLVARLFGFSFFDFISYAGADLQLFHMHGL